MEASALLRAPKQELLKQLPVDHQAFFKWFLALTEVHRPSFQLEGARKTCIEWAHKLGATVAEDEIGNILLSIPASAGLENVKPLCIQGHLDIVSVGKFDEQGQVFLKLEDGKLTSGISTIGADDGIAVAAMYALIETRDKYQHGPLEFLITLDEEVGLIGAGKLAGPPFLKSRALLNLDSEEWGTFYTSCAGGLSAYYELPIKKEKVEGTGLKLHLTNLMGGHTGLLIDSGRSNSVKWIDRILLEIQAQGIPFRLATIEGGDKHNAIPSECIATVVTTEPEKFEALAKKLHDEIVKESKAIEVKGPKLAIEKVDVPLCLCECCHNKVLDLLSSIYHGVWEMHPEIKGIVRTSQSMSITRTKDDVLYVQVYARSNEATRMYWLVNQNKSLARAVGCPIRIPEEEIQGPWPAALKARITEIAKESYHKLYNAYPEITAIHAGLECGCIQNRGYPDLECVSYGPTIHGAHSVEESVTVETACKCFNLTLEIIKAWAQE